MNLPMNQPMNSVSPQDSIELSTLNAQNASLQEENLDKIFALLKISSHTDFSQYKRSTLLRRIARRMLVRKTGTIEEYFLYLERHPNEIKALCEDILIHVTGFFRDAKLFSSLQNKILPKYMTDRDPCLPFRVWVPGCSTGEEAYSIAMTFLEFLDRSQIHPQIRTPLSIFATDISEQALQKARLGVYPESISQELSKERLDRFFERVPGGGFKIIKSLREMCLFSRHDVTHDPPFAKLDLISCRNVLIYFDSQLQKQLFPIFHYALHPNGTLMLGRSETIGRFENIFTALDKQNKIYSKRTIKTRVKFQFPLGHYSLGHSLGRLNSLGKGNQLPSRIDIKLETDRIALSEYSPPSVTVNDSLDIIQSHGTLSPFLELAPGLPSLNLLRMAHPQLVAELRTAILEARKTFKPVQQTSLILHSKDKIQTLSIKVVPLSGPPNTQECYLVIFFEEDRNLGSKTEISQNKLGRTSKRAQEIDDFKLQLTHEMEKRLAANHQYQQSLIEEYETSQEALVSSNEELQSTIEELQSTNEELETAKEELQSANEELTTVNNEMQTRNSELKRAADELEEIAEKLTNARDDATTIIEAQPIPLLVIDSNQGVKQANDIFYEHFRVSRTETEGKLVSALGNGQWNIPTLIELINSTLTQGIQFQDYEVSHVFQNIGHRTMMLNARKVHLPGSGQETALITIEDITERKRIDMELRMAEEKYRNLLETAHDGVLIIDSQGRIEFANQRIESIFGYDIGELTGKMFDVLIPDRLRKDKAVIYKQYIAAPEPREMGAGLDLYGRRRDGTEIPVEISFSPVRTGAETFVTTIVRDTSERKETEKRLAGLMVLEQKAREEAEKANRAKDEFLATLSHELRTPLTAILSWVQMLRLGRLDPNKSKRGIEIMERCAMAQRQLIDDLLDISRIQAGKLMLSLRCIDPVKVLFATIDSVRNLILDKELHLETAIDPTLGLLLVDPDRLQQILWNLIMNAIKFTPGKGTISIQLDRISASTGEHLRIQVRDTGKGIKPDFLPVIFERFSQADSSSTRSYGGLGLGLAIVHKLVEMHEGKVEAESPGEGQGAVFTVTIPIKSYIHSGTILEQADSEIDLETESSPNTLVGKRVLVVEDDENTREVLTLMLHSCGAEVKSVESVKAALAILEEFNPDVVVSDVAMPQEDGYNLIRKIRKMNGKLSQIPAIAVTAYAGEDNRRAALEAGFQAHIAKPVNAHKLVQAVAKRYPLTFFPLF